MEPCLEARLSIVALHLTFALSMRRHNHSSPCQTIDLRIAHVFSTPTIKRFGPASMCDYHNLRFNDYHKPNSNPMTLSANLFSCDGCSSQLLFQRCCGVKPRTMDCKIRLSVCETMLCLQLSIPSIIVLRGFYDHGHNPQNLTKKNE